MIQTIKKIFVLFFAIAFLASCENPFGDKTDLSFIDVPNYDEQPIAFVPIQPALKDFDYPSAVFVGYDELVYIADQGRSIVYCFDQSGKKIAQLSIPGLKSVAMDRSLNLLALGAIDTIINGNTFKLDAVFRYELASSDGYGLANARLVKRTIHPFYFKTSFTTSDTATHFNAISIMADNNYYITRSGPSNSPTQIGGPDDAVLVFNSRDKFVTTVNVQTAQGLMSDYFKKPFAITTLAKGPQSPIVKQGGDFIFTSVNPGTTIKTQYISFVSSEFGSSYSLNTALAGQDTSKANGFIYSPDKFSSPVGVTIAGDGSNFIFVADAAKDSVYLFSLNGLEGIQPPPGYAAKKYIKVSFGGSGLGPKQFNRPVAVAYHNQILYVCDAGNGRVTRFKLSTEFIN